MKRFLAVGLLLLAICGFAGCGSEQTELTATLTKSFYGDFEMKSEDVAAVINIFEEEAEVNNGMTCDCAYAYWIELSDGTIYSFSDHSAVIQKPDGNMNLNITGEQADVLFEIVDSYK